MCSFVALWLTLSILVALLGTNRTCGFNRALKVCLFFSPVVGAFYVGYAERLTASRSKPTSSPSSVAKHARQAVKLQQLEQQLLNGSLTVAEFSKQRQELLASQILRMPHKNETKLECR